MRAIHRPRTRAEQRYRRHLRVRRKISGTAHRPRLVVFRSLKHTYAQIVDDAKGVTVAAYSSRASGFVTAEEKRGKVGKAFAVGQGVAKLAKDQGITNVVFDRGGYLYHGRVRAVADGARDGGLEL